MAAAKPYRLTKSGHCFLAAATGAAHELEGDERLPAQGQSREKDKGRRRENKVEDQEKSSSRL